MENTILVSISEELKLLKQQAEIMLKEQRLGNETKTNQLYSSCINDLNLILKQISPVGNDLLKIIKSELPSRVNRYQYELTGILAGYIDSTTTLVNKLINKQISFGVRTFEPNKFSNKVFIVHGHDLEMLEIVNSFLREINLSPIILHEQPNKGRTIIEKFMDYSDVGFSVVLLSPDDKSIENSKETNRARQNVIFELGYFIGKLGRDRVAALYKKSVEIPSDYSGVLYIEFNDSEIWKIQLCKELKEVGFNIDLNILIK